MKSLMVAQKGTQRRDWTTARQLALADVFRRAADIHLDETSLAEATLTTSPFSCCALDRAAKKTRKSRVVNLAESLVAKLGCPTYLDAFSEFLPDAERQGARFLWLDFVREGLERGLIDLPESYSKT